MWVELVDGEQETEPDLKLAWKKKENTSRQGLDVLFVSLFFFK